MVSKARLDFPEPDSPVNTIRLSLGRSRSTPRRLCSLAPRTTRRSATDFPSVERVQPHLGSRGKAWWGPAPMLGAGTDNSRGPPSRVRFATRQAFPSSSMSPRLSGIQTHNSADTSDYAGMSDDRIKHLTGYVGGPRDR